MRASSATTWARRAWAFVSSWRRAFSSATPASEASATQELGVGLGEGAEGPAVADQGAARRAVDQQGGRQDRPVGQAIQFRLDLGGQADRPVAQDVAGPDGPRFGDRQAGHALAPASAAAAPSPPERRAPRHGCSGAARSRARVGRCSRSRRRSAAGRRPGAWRPSAPGHRLPGWPGRCPGPAWWKASVARSTPCSRPRERSSRQDSAPLASTVVVRSLTPVHGARGARGPGGPAHRAPRLGDMASAGAPPRQPQARAGPARLLTGR